MLFSLFHMERSLKAEDNDVNFFHPKATPSQLPRHTVAFVAFVVFIRQIKVCLI